MSAKTLVGQTALCVIKHLVAANSSIVALSFFKYTAAPPVQERAVLSSEALDIVARALELKEQRRMPFLDGLMLNCYGAKGNLQGLFDACLHHQQPSETFTLSRHEVLSGTLDNVAANLASSAGLAVNSRVVVGGAYPMHFKMMDFGCPPSEENLPVVRSILRRLMPEGFVVLNSGRSLHSYGLVLQPESDLLAFAGKALLFAPVVDRAYVAHRLIDAQFSLRVCGGLLGKPDPVALLVEGDVLS